MRSEQLLAALAIASRGAGGPWPAGRKRTNHFHRTKAERDASKKNHKRERQARKKARKP